MPRVLLVEDHAALARATAEGLRGAGYDADVAADGVEALARVDRSAYAAIVLDWMLPRLDGAAVLRRLRADGWETPVIMLTARDDVVDRVRALDSGADDYLVKPFALDELLARLRAVIRRRAGGTRRVIEVAGLAVDTGSRTVFRGAREIPLSAREYAILECLALHRGRIVSRERLLEHCYDGDERPESNVVDVYVAHLRRRLTADGSPSPIQTRRGLGYLLGGGDE